MRFWLNSMVMVMMSTAAMAAPTLPVAATPDALPVNEVTTGEVDIALEVNKGQMIRLDRPVDSIIIAAPDTADVQVVSPRLLFVYGRAVGQTSLYAIDANDDTIFSAVVRVSHNISELQRMVHQVAPNADVDFQSTNGGLIMKGRASSPTESEDIRSIAQSYIGTGALVNMINTNGSNQVSIQVKVVEMSRNDLKRLNVNLQAAITPGSLGLQILQGADIALGAGGLVNRGSNNTALFSSWSGSNASVSSLIDLLETQGMASVLAEPNLTTTSGRPASFLAGGEYPIQLAGPDGIPSVEYRPFGVSLDFTPTVLSKDRISMSIAPEVSTISFDTPVAGNPILLTRRAQATVEVGSGQSFVLAGLLKRDISNSMSKLPGIGDIPVLGALFRSNQFQNDLTELVIIVTPYIVRPVSDHSLKTPLDGYVPPSDYERMVEGKLYQQEPMEPVKRNNDAVPALHGRGGFILE